MGFRFLFRCYYGRRVSRWKGYVMFYEFRQNNSGGTYVFTDQVGLYTLIEAKDADDACKRAVEDHGMWFDGVANHVDCHCCGDRWSRPWGDENGTIGPTVYGKLPSEHMEGCSVHGRDQLCEGDAEIVVHYMNGCTSHYGCRAKA